MFKFSYIKIILLLIVFFYSPAVFAVNQPENNPELQKCLEAATMKYMQGEIDEEKLTNLSAQCYSQNGYDYALNLPQDNLQLSDGFNKSDSQSDEEDKFNQCVLKAKKNYQEETKKCFKQAQTEVYKSLGRIDNINQNLTEKIAQQSLKCNEEVLQKYQNKLIDCYELKQFSGIWAIPELKQSIVNQFKDFHFLQPEEVDLLYTCLDKVAINHGLKDFDSELYRDINNCFQKVGLNYQGDIFNKTAIVIDCAHDSLGVNSFAGLGQINEKQKAYLEQCIVKKVAPVVTGVAVINIPLAGGFTNTLLYLQLLFAQPFIFLQIRKRRQEIGKVFDAFSQEPVDLCAVRLIDTQEKKVVKTVVTNKLGQYIFLPNPGLYSLQIIKNGYSFPSQLIDKNLDKIHYFGEEIKIDTIDDVVSPNVPIDPALKEKSSLQISLAKWRNRLSVFIAFLSPISTIIAFAFIQKLWLGFLSGFQILLLLIFLRLSLKKKPPQFGRVLNKKGQTLSKVMISLYDKKYGRLLRTYVSDFFGRYYFPIVNGEYVLVARKKGYKEYKKDIKVEIEPNEIFSLDIILDKI